MLSDTSQHCISSLKEGTVVVVRMCCRQFPQRIPSPLASCSRLSHQQQPSVRHPKQVVGDPWGMGKRSKRPPLTQCL